MNIVEAKAIDIAAEGIIFNAPEIDEEFEALRAQDIAEIDAQEERMKEQTLAFEAEALESALDKVFNDMIAGNKLEEGEMDFAVEGEEENLDASINEAIIQAKDLDIDLAFLNDTDESNEVDSEV
jgi:predicted DNA-binding protein (UPF0251 family)